MFFCLMIRRPTRSTRTVTLFPYRTRVRSTITWGHIPLDHVADEELPLLDRAAAAGGKLIGQSHSRGIYLLWSFLTQTPYDWIPEWRNIRSLPLEQQRRSEEHTSELQSLMRISYAVFCLKKKNTTTKKHATVSPTIRAQH